MHCQFLWAALICDEILLNYDKFNSLDGSDSKSVFFAFKIKFVLVCFLEFMINSKVLWTIRKIEGSRRNEVWGRIIVTINNKLKTKEIHT